MKIQKAVSIKKVNNKNNTKDDLDFWLTKSSEERVSAVEFLRRQSHGSSNRLQRVIRIIQRS
jgi:hypothetical protein